LKSFFRSYWAALLWAAFILLLCGLPGEDLPNIDFWEINIEDKLAHVFVFAVLAILMVIGSTRSAKTQLSRKLVLSIILIGVLYGALTEILQGWLFPSRYMSLSDFIADALGAILGTVFAFLYFTNRKE
jgi:VanZ family protein